MTALQIVLGSFLIVITILNVYILVWGRKKRFSALESLKQSMKDLYEKANNRSDYSPDRIYPFQNDAGEQFLLCLGTDTVLLQKRDTSQVFSKDEISPSLLVEIDPKKTYRYNQVAVKINEGSILIFGSKTRRRKSFFGSFIIKDAQSLVDILGNWLLEKPQI